MISEFEIIKSYFSGLQTLSTGVALGIGDDAAVIDIPSNFQLVIATDTLVTDVHFPADLDPFHIATRALGVNLSDMAAMGADPKWFSLAITLPSADLNWLQKFSAGLAEMATTYNCSLIGGDTTRGPLSITMTLHGLVPYGKALTRSGAEVGDRIFVSGRLGLGATGLAVLQNKLSVVDPVMNEMALQKFRRPEPQIGLGQKLLGIASAALDVSDGLMADLGHIAKASGVGASVELNKLDCLQELDGAVDLATRINWVLGGGDDYELCFTVPETKLPELYAMLNKENLSVHEIGNIVTCDKVVCLDETGQQVNVHQQGYMHF